jgi:hypothetical protein
LVSFVTLQLERKDSLPPTFLLKDAHALFLNPPSTEKSKFPQVERDSTPKTSFGELRKFVNRYFSAKQAEAAHQILGDQERISQVGGECLVQADR